MSGSGDFHFTPIEFPPSPGKNLRSKLGAASAYLGLLAVLVFGLGFFLSNIEQIPFPWQIRYSVRENIEAIRIIVYVLLCVTPLIGMAGLGLGIAATILKDANKKLGILGLVVNGIMLVFPLCSFVIFFLIK